jgi:large subunit ribosomal protein L29
MKNSEIKEMTDAELTAKVTELQQERYNLKCQGRTGELTNSAKIGQIRKDIARIKTEQKARSVKTVAE